MRKPLQIFKQVFIGTMYLFSILNLFFLSEPHTIPLGRKLFPTLWTMARYHYTRSFFPRLATFMGELVQSVSTSSIDPPPPPPRSDCIEQPIQPKEENTKQSWKTIIFKESCTTIKEKMIILDKPISSSLDLYNEPLSSSDLPDSAMPLLLKPTRLKLDG